MPKSATISKNRPAQPQNAQTEPQRSAIVPVTDGSLDGSTDLEGTPEPTPSFVVLPAHEEIAARAYALSQARTNDELPGDEMSDWLQAERELIAERD